MPELLIIMECIVWAIPTTHAWCMHGQDCMESNEGNILPDDINYNKVKTMAFAQQQYVTKVVSVSAKQFVGIRSRNHACTTRCIKT
jgi:hypothetical protein